MSERDWSYYPARGSKTALHAAAAAFQSVREMSCFLGRSPRGNKHTCKHDDLDSLFGACLPLRPHTHRPLCLYDKLFVPCNLCSIWRSGAHPQTSSHCDRRNSFIKIKVVRVVLRTLHTEYQAHTYNTTHMSCSNPIRVRSTRRERGEISTGHVCTYLEGVALSRGHW